MNWNRGFKRIVLLISIPVGLGLGVWGFFWVGDYTSLKNYKLECEKTEAIETVNFWNIWKEGGFDKKEVIADMQYVPTWLDKEKYEFNHQIWFKIKGKEFYLIPSEVFPDINKTYLNLPDDELDRLAKIAKSKAIANTNKTFDIFRTEYTPTFLLILYAILAGLAGGAGGFVSIWTIYFLLRYSLKWIIVPPIQWIKNGFADKQKEE